MKSNNEYLISEEKVRTFNIDNISKILLKVVPQYNLKKIQLYISPIGIYMNFMKHYYPNHI